MINVAHSRAAIVALDSDRVILTKAQLDELLAEVETGQHARRQLISIRTVVNLAANSSGASA